MSVRTAHVADDNNSLAHLVTSAAAAAPDVPAICKPGLTVTFGELATRATGAAGAMTGGTTIDDSALTMVLMMTVPGLAMAGPSGLAATLSAIRIQATMALAGQTAPEPR
ncbi:hypothetical protein [Williamsia sp.]|uniref:hypothetical protein n=1 Tax=Williamsia sp. TaxID=1872085 RepID=UPI001A255285|nr:hypothetical protein [Williamsia sp.]MBJ7287713.1 hypothetical protein [Williamsia sp.]